MNQQYVSPKYGEEGFNCPSCQAYSHHYWHEVKENGKEEYIILSFLRKVSITASVPTNQINGYLISNKLALSTCFKCTASAYWVGGEMIYPSISLAPPANPDMPESVIEIYQEARKISSLSPRASAALLRLALEKLLPQIGAKKSNIDTMIGELVGKGLPIEVEKALDGLRVIGNEAVHPGTIDVQDSSDITAALFKLLNFVVDRMITQKKAIDEIYDLIPETKIQGIVNRNQKAISKQEKEQLT